MLRRESFRGNESARFRVFFVKHLHPVSIMLKPMHVGEEIRDPSDDEGAVGHWLPVHGDEAEPARGAAGGLSGCGSSTSVLQGILRRVDGESLWIGPERSARGGTETGIRHELAGLVTGYVAGQVTGRVRLDALIGLAVRVTIVREPPPAEAKGRRALDRTLTVSGVDGRVWLIARTGTVRGVTHVLSPQVSLGAALSQRPGGPLVIGTSELQWLVSPGTAARLPMRDGTAFCLLLVDRRPDDTASYVLADESLFAEEWS